MLNEQQYLLTLIQEECAELSQRASKALRFGLYEVQEGQPLNNWERLKGEYTDLLSVISELDKSLLDVDDNKIMNKIDKINKYMELSRERGILK